jgi:hypothetical protein
MPKSSAPTNEAVGRGIKHNLQNLPEALQARVIGFKARLGYNTAASPASRNVPFTSVSPHTMPLPQSLPQFTTAFMPPQPQLPAPINTATFQSPQPRFPAPIAASLQQSRLQKLEGELAYERKMRIQADAGRKKAQEALKAERKLREAAESTAVAERVCMCLPPHISLRLPSCASSHNLQRAVKPCQTKSPTLAAQPALALKCCVRLEL